MKVITSIDKATENITLPIMESFYTLQGEGFHSGKAAYFIRTAGCDVGCHWCDVKESWEISKDQYKSISNIVEDARKSTGKIAVITGGEPLMYDMDLLTNALKNDGFDTHLETSGAYPLSGDWNWICFSPKKFKKPLDEFYSRADELKVVIYNKSDFQWAEKHASKMRNGAKLFLQPEWSRKDQVVPLIIDYVKDNPEWQITFCNIFLALIKKF
jgi:organic radical activating enzyme